MPKIEQILELQEQTVIPTDSLANTAQVYYDVYGDMYVKLHQGGDPGNNATFQIIDLLYGLVPWKVKAIPDGTQTIIMDATIFTCTPDEATEWNTAGGFSGQIVLFKVDNTAGKQIDFNTGFTDITSILATDTGIQNRLCYFDGTTWREIKTGLFSIIGTENQTIRINASGNAEVTNILKVHADGAEITVDHPLDNATPRLLNGIPVEIGQSRPSSIGLKSGTMAIWYIP